MVSPPGASRSPAPGREGQETSQPEGTILLLLHMYSWAGAELGLRLQVTKYTAVRELPNMGQEDKDKDSPNVIGAVTKKVQGMGSQRNMEQLTLKTEGTKT